MKGQPDLKHWKQDKEISSGYSEFYKENNKILEDFKAIYWKLITEHPELSAKRIIDKYRGQSKDGYIFPIMDDKREKTYKTKTIRSRTSGKN